MALVLVVSVVVWYWTRDTLPPAIGIASGQSPGGLYDDFAHLLEAQFEKRTSCDASVLATEGSV